MTTTTTIAAFDHSPDGGRGLSRRLTLLMSTRSLVERYFLRANARYFWRSTWPR